MQATAAHQVAEQHCSRSRTNTLSYSTRWACITDSLSCTTLRVVIFDSIFHFYYARRSVPFPRLVALSGKKGNELTEETTNHLKTCCVPLHRHALKRVLIGLTTGYIIVYYGELVFRATPEREGMTVGSIIITWLAYSVMAYVFLCVVSVFQVRNVWAVFLAGAFYGWCEEGIVVQTMYGTADGPFPLSISFTGLAWLSNPLGACRFQMEAATAPRRMVI